MYTFYYFVVCVLSTLSINAMLCVPGQEYTQQLGLLLHSCAT